MSALEQYYEQSPPQLMLIQESQQVTTRYGLGVIAVDNGTKRGTYTEAPALNAEPYTWMAPGNPELERYRSYNFNWPGAIVLRQKWHTTTQQLLTDFPHLGRE